MTKSYQKESRKIYIHKTDTVTISHLLYRPYRDNDFMYKYHNQMKSNDFLLKVAYLGDFFSEVNPLNLTLQGGRQWLHTTHDKVAAFKRGSGTV